MMRSLIFVFGLFLLVPNPGMAASTRMNVQVQSGQVRATATYLGKIVTTVPYGVSVEVLKQQGDWIQVKTLQGQTGWMHKSALTTKKVSMSAGTTTAKTAASSDELALAGKGFSAQVEKEYQAKNKNLNFAAVDRMEMIKIPPVDMQKFLASGQVNPTEGGVQ
jgi:uncharacterized protein YgiM (DUF1202 family)